MKPSSHLLSVSRLALVLCSALGLTGACSSKANPSDGGGGTSGDAQTGSGGGAGHTASDAGADSSTGGAIGGGGGATGLGGHTGAGGAGGAGGTSGMGGAGGNPGCASAIANAACSTEGALCNGCTDICLPCNSLRCTGGHWAAMEAVAAPCFPCGTGHCQTNAEYCEKTIGGAVGNPPHYRCGAVPSTCRPTPTCACLIPVSTTPCQMAGAGELTVTLAAP